MATKKVSVEVIEKKAKFPIEVVLVGGKAALALEGEALVKHLAKNLPIVMRLGRGRKETIVIRAKATA